MDYQKSITRILNQHLCLHQNYCISPARFEPTTPHFRVRQPDQVEKELIPVKIEKESTTTIKTEKGNFPKPEREIFPKTEKESFPFPFDFIPMQNNQTQGLFIDNFPMNYKFYIIFVLLYRDNQCCKEP